MPLFLLVFGIGSDQLGVLVQPQAPAILAHLVYQNLLQSWTRACSGHCWALGRVRATVEPRVQRRGLWGRDGALPGTKPPIPTPSHFTMTFYGE